MSAAEKRGSEPQPNRGSFDAGHTAPAATRRLRRGEFICQADLIVTNAAKCEHCGQTEEGVCGRFPTLQQERIDALAASLREMIECYGSDDGRIERAHAALAFSKA